MNALSVLKRCSWLKDGTAKTLGVLYVQWSTGLFLWIFFFSECALISHNALWRWWVVGILSVSACGTYKDYLSPSLFFWHHTYVHTNDPQDEATLGVSAQFSPTVLSRCFFYACTSTLIGAVMAVTYLLYISTDHEFKTDTSSTHDHDIFHTHSGWISQRSQQSRYN